MTTFVIVKSPIETKYYWLELSNTSKTSAVTANTYVDKTTDQTIAGTKTFTGQIELNSRIINRNTQIVNESIINNNTSITLAFPLEEQIILTSTLNVTVLLPDVTTNNIGFKFTFIKGSSITNHITFSTNTPIVIIKKNEITGTTSYKPLDNAITTVTFVTFTDGTTYAWKEL
jgi:hypothetical protein